MHALLNLRGLLIDLFDPAEVPECNSSAFLGIVAQDTRALHALRLCDVLFGAPNRSVLSGTEPPRALSAHEHV